MFPINFARTYNRLAFVTSRHVQCYNKIIWLSARNASLPSKYVPESSQTGQVTSSRSLAFPKILSSTTDGTEQEGVIDCEEELMEELEQDVAESGSRSFGLKDLLYPETQDEILLKLNDCKNSEEILEMVQKYGAQFNQQHATQTVLVLWAGVQHDKSNNLKHDFLHSPQFKSFLNFLCSLIPDMNYEEMTCNLLYLQKLGLNSSEKVMQELLCHITNSVKRIEDEVPLTALSRLAVAVTSNKHIFQFLVTRHILSHALKYLEKDLDAEDIRLLTICMKHLNQLVTKDIQDLYRNKIKDGIDKGIITSNDSRCIIKVLPYLNFPHWCQENTLLIRSLLLLLKSEFGNLSVKELERVVRVVHSQLEPASIIPTLKEATNKLYAKCPAISTLDCLMHFVEPKRRQTLLDAAEKMLRKEELTLDQLPKVFRILRSLKISNISVCNKYWSSVLDAIRNNPSEQELHKLFRHCHRYMHFNNNLGGTFHHKEFEKTMCELLTKDIEEGLSGIMPSKLVRSASFIIAYGGCTEMEDEIPAKIMTKLEKMATQLSILDCLQLSRGLQIALELRFRNNISLDAAQRMHRIGIILDVCAKRHLRQGVGLPELNNIVRSFINRKAQRKKFLFQNTIDKYKNSIKYLNSRLIRDISFNLTTCNYVMPQVYEKIFEYIYNNREYVTGDTVEKVLTCCYNVGYMPENIEVLYWCDEIIKRDFQFMNSLSVVQACLALCYYKSLSEQLTNKVFTIDFIQQVEDEIQTCYSKETYPERILNQVMQLNRAVCLDYPETQVPWFQQNYIEAQMSKQPNVQTKFHVDVKNLLVSIVKDESLVKSNHVTPYGYRIDFVVHLNRNNKFILPPKDNLIMIQISKIAILLHKLDSFRERRFTTMRGSELLKLRHLEILGYKVVHINFNEWNAVYMNMPGAKVKYLKNLLQIE